MAGDFAHKPVLRGALVTLRPATADDAATFHAMLSDAEVLRLTGAVHSSAERPAWPAEQLREVYARWAVATDRTVFAIVDNRSRQVVGESVLNDLHAEDGWCNFRIWISGARDRGLGTEATRLTLRHAFEDLGLHRVELEVYDFNPRARHVYEKVGFIHEGTRRHALRYDGEWIDAHLMSILAPEWAHHHGHP